MRIGDWREREKGNWKRECFFDCFYEVGGLLSFSLVYIER